jgi:hypothetical protein
LSASRRRKRVFYDDDISDIGNINDITDIR